MLIKVGRATANTDNSYIIFQKQQQKSANHIFLPPNFSAELSLLSTRACETPLHQDSLLLLEKVYLIVSCML